jgi:hypothetical protein
MRHRPLLAIAVFALPAVIAAPLGAADTADAAKQRLAQVEGLSEKDGGYAWTEGASTLKAVDVDDDRVQIDADGVKVAVPVRFIAWHSGDVAAAIPKLAKAAKAGGLSTKLEADFTALTGPLLRADTAVVVDSKVLKAVPTVKPTDRPKDLDQIKAAAKKLTPGIKASGMNDEAQKACDFFLGKLTAAETGLQADDLNPWFARCLVRSGLFDGMLKGDASVAALKQAVLAAEKMQPTHLFTSGEASGATTYAELRDAFGHGGWVLTTPTKVSYGVPHPEPLFLEPLKLDLVVDLPAKADATADDEKATGARLYHQSTLVASWDGKQLTADPKTWRESVPSGKGAVCADVLPPSIAICAMNGDRRRLIVATGTVRPPKDASAAEGERFIADAAKALPDTASLDLVGEYLFRYVYDSPDPRFPTVIGNKACKGDIHQTAAQTTALVAGGMVRGDCDDASELYLTLREKQGGHGHVALLPSHAACVYAVKDGDQWRANLLQTGPPYSIVAPKLPDALKALYTAFDPAAAFDPNGVGILLRFSGENTRGPWRLSWRIFAEPDYSKTMVEVQRDWQYETYERGIATMEKMIAGGDKDPANYRELSGLASFTGQYALAAEWNQKAIDANQDAVSKLTMNLEQIVFLHDAGKGDEAKALAADVLDKQIPPLREKLGNGLLDIAFEHAGACLHAKDYDLATRCLKDTVAGACDRLLKQLSAYTQSQQFDAKAWDQLEAQRRIVHQYVGLCIQLLREVGKEKAQKDPIQQALAMDAAMWVTFVAFHEGDDDGDWMDRYAEIGGLHRFLVGDQALIDKLEAAKFPTDAKHDHAKRGNSMDDARLAADLPWVKLSVPFWFGLLAEQFDREKDKIDVDAAKRYGKDLIEAAAACKKLGIAAPQIDEEAHLGTLIVALLDQDAKTVKERLAFVAKENDKRLRDDTAQWLGDCARVLDEAWYGKVIDIWKQEVDYKPKWFWVAWRAALNKAPKLALEVAKRAADEYKDDPSFREEYDFMKKLLDQPAAQKATTP